MTNRVVVSARQAGNHLLGSLKGLQIRAQVYSTIGGQWALGSSVEEAPEST
jgi:hypothetical protein